MSRGALGHLILPHSPGYTKAVWSDCKSKAWERGIELTRWSVVASLESGRQVTRTRYAVRSIGNGLKRLWGKACATRTSPDAPQENAGQIWARSAGQSRDNRDSRDERPLSPRRQCYHIERRWVCWAYMFCSGRQATITATCRWHAQELYSTAHKNLDDDFLLMSCPGRIV